MSRVISSFLVLSPMMLSAIVVTNEYVMYNHNTGSIIEPGHTAVCNLITNNVAPWAMAGQIKPKTDLTPSTNYTDTCCSTLAVAATNYTDAATNDATLVHYNANGSAGAKLKHGTNVVTAADIGALPNSTTHLSGDVPISRTVNGYELSGDISLSADNVGALPAIYDAQEGYYHVADETYFDVTLHAHQGLLAQDVVLRNGIGWSMSTLAIYSEMLFPYFYDTELGAGKRLKGVNGIILYGSESGANNEIAVKGDIPDTSSLATKSAVESVSNTVAYLTATQATHTATLATKIDANDATTISESVVSEHIYYASTNLADNVELRLYSGEWVNAEYDGVGTADVILDLTGVPANKVTDTLMVLNCAATGTLRVATSTNACRVIHKKDANPLELKAGLNLLTFSRYRMANGTNEVLVTNNEME